MHGLFGSCSFLPVLLFCLQCHWIFQQTCSGDSDWVAGNPVSLWTSWRQRKKGTPRCEAPPRVLLLNIQMSISATDPFIAEGGEPESSCSVVSRGIMIILEEVWGEMGWLFPTRLLLDGCLCEAVSCIASVILPWHCKGNNKWPFYFTKPAQLAVSVCSFRNAPIAAWGQRGGGQPGSLMSAF